jgi:hypothetical protein
LSDTTPAFTSFIYDTIAPDVPTLLAPMDGITVSPIPPGYFWQGPVGDTGSSLAYNLQIDDLVLTHSTTFYTAPIWLANGPHSWRVRAFDAAGNYSPWTGFWTFVADHYDFRLPLIFKNSDS